jgi:N-acetylglucosamine-6-phosphate deacetylase
MAVEIIADGHHLPPELIRMIVKIKGVDQVAAVTDSLYPAGTDLKEGCTDGVSFIVEGGVCRLPDRSAFAGSIATADRLLQVLHRDCGIALIQAVKMLTAVPARIMGLDVGVIAQGRPADLVLLDENLHVRDVFVGGKKVS